MGLLSVLMAPSLFANVEMEILLTWALSRLVTSKKASPSVSAQEVEALPQSTSNQGQRGLAILAGLPALTKPLLSVSNAPGEATPQQRLGAIQNVPLALWSVRTALRSCAWWTDRSLIQKLSLPELFISPQFSTKYLLVVLLPRTRDGIGSK